MKKIALALALLFSPSVSRADQLYAVNGSLTIVGNNVCSGPCVETLNFSFVFSEQLPQHGLGYYLSVVPGTSSVLSSGPLGTFSGPTGPFNSSPGPGGTNISYMVFRSPLSSGLFNEIDIWPSENGQLQPFVPQIAGADLWACGTQDCENEFCVPGKSFVGCPSPLHGLLANMVILGTVESVATPIPEPDELSLLGIAFSVLFLLRIRSECTRVSSLRRLRARLVTPRQTRLPRRPRFCAACNQHSRNS
jgi:hypothetical protein